MKTANIEDEYKKDTKIKPDDIKSLQEWVQKQPHLPKITDLQAILFLHSCYCSNEMAKHTIDTFFTVRALCPEFFRDRNPRDKDLVKHMNVVVHLPLEKKTPEGYTVFLSHMMSGDPDIFHLPSQLKIWDMMAMLHLNENGTSDGHVIVLDYDGIVFGHLAKLGIITIKKWLYYLQDALPIRLKALHFFNTVPFMDKILALMKPFMKKELIEVLYLHENVESLSKFVPIECLPENYGGTMKPINQLHDEMKKKLIDNSDFFSQEETMVANESLRPGKPKTVNDIFGVEGTFKKLDID